ncbi:MAG: putative metal-binding motif-containing protein [Myxococcales bacterium]|nr:putative metal-binding motif-containing protein [Myxococcales bacterium]
MVDMDGDGVAAGRDCNDGDRTIFPGATEVCDGVDQDCDGTIDWGFTVPTTHATIQAAAAAAPRAARICVLDGTHAGFGIADSALVIEGQSRDRTIIAGSATDTAPFVRLQRFDGTLRNVTLTGGARGALRIFSAGATARLENLMVRGVNLTSSGDCSGIVHVEDAGVELRDVFVENNVVDCNNVGAGFVSLSGASVLDRVFIRGNRMTTGGDYRGALFAYRSTVAARSVVIAGNAASSRTSGREVFAFGFVSEAGTATVTNATIVGNTADATLSVRAIAVASTFSGAIAISNSVIAFNTASAGSARYAYDVLAGSTIAYNDVFANDAISGQFVSSSAVDPTGTLGNLAADPMFVSRSGADPTAWNLRLAAGSSLIDAGDPALLDRDTTRSDIGAYGGPASP